VSFRQIKGHEAQIAGLQRSYAAGRLAHAYLFVGPEGVGKQRVALALAKALLCRHRDADALDACTDCSSCRRFQAGSHPDFNLLALPEDRHELPIDMVRELTRWIGLKPADADRKVAVVDDAHTMSMPAANSFLKTLEEPPPGSVLILVAVEADQLLPTILSRCQVLRFGPLAEGDLMAVLSALPVQMDPKMAARVVRAADGSVSAALRLADPTVWEFREGLVRHLAAGRWDDPLLVSEAVTDFAKGASKLSAEHRERAAVALRFAAAFFRDVVAYQLAGDGAALLFEEDRPLVVKAAESLWPDAAVRIVRRTLEAAGQNRRYANLGLVIDSWFLDVASLAAGTPVQTRPEGRG